MCEASRGGGTIASLEAGLAGREVWMTHEWVEAVKEGAHGRIMGSAMRDV
jgi:hypothetical protein